jgi:hypothetical protein
MKSFKDLFIKSEEDDDEVNKGKEPQPARPVTGFPVNSTQSLQNSNPSGPNNPYLEEIILIYEKGLDSINMPGYDFYDFFSAIKAAGSLNEAVFKMAFQMGKTMDASLNAQKLVTDADFYLSKLRDVHQKYADQGQQKLNSILSQSRTERETLSNSANSMEVEIARLKQQIADLERNLADTRTMLSKVDAKHKPQQDVIEQKMQANNEALRVSTQKLTSVRDAIQTYLK